MRSGEVLGRRGCGFDPELGALGKSQHRRCHLAQVFTVSLWLPHGEYLMGAARRETIGKGGGKGQLLEVFRGPGWK